MTVDDPKTWTRPWTIMMPLTLDDSYLIAEYACHEGNYAMFNILSGARADEKAAADAAAKGLPPPNQQAPAVAAAVVAAAAVVQAVVVDGARVRLARAVAPHRNSSAESVRWSNRAKARFCDGFMPAVAERAEGEHMRRLILGAFPALVGAVILATAGVSGQGRVDSAGVMTPEGGVPALGSYKVPKTPWGEPDLQGTYNANDLQGIQMQRAATVGTRYRLSDDEYKQRVAQRDQNVANDNSDEFTLERAEEFEARFGTVGARSRRRRTGSNARERSAACPRTSSSRRTDGFRP